MLPFALSRPRIRQTHVTATVFTLLCLVPATAFTATTPLNRTFRLQAKSSSIKMDLEQPNRRFLRSFPHLPRLPVIGQSEPPQFSHGMPWRFSICDDYDKEGLLYAPFFDWQVDYMRQHLTNLRQLPVVDRTGRDMSYRANDVKGIRIHTSQFASDEYRLIRLTVMDAGHRLQVFTSLWYPREDANLPVLGIDLLHFNRKKHLCICDLQRIQETEDDHAVPYEHLLRPIRDAHPLLQGKMTERFYDQDQFFSNQILLGRADEDGDAMIRQMSSAVQQYTQVHVDLVQSTPPSESVLHRHQAYDIYSAARDPAQGLLASNFGKEWADAYVHDVLFPLSRAKLV